MSEILKNQYVPDIVSPPGETLQEILLERGMSQADLAGRTGRPLKTINEIVKGKASITPETAIQLEHVLGIPSSFWTNRELQYREAIARSRETESIASQTDWLKEIPYSAMAKLGWVPSSESRIAQVQHLLKFFGVASSSSWGHVWAETHAVFRQSPTFRSEPGAVAAWLRKGEIEGFKIHAVAFDAAAFRDVLVRIRTLTRELPENFGEILTNECRRAGVKVVFVPELPKTCAWGATRWVSPSSALIQLSLRYKTDDHLWFTFFHEAGHILLHGKRDLFVETDVTTKSDKELQADSFARDFLIPEPEYKKFLRLRSLSCAAISRFAHDLDIAAGIVVGRLQHDRVLPPTHCNNLKRHFTWLSREG